jgi:hydroxymethylpyrimidine pyrophosphatase-like HAD family hydrolase
VSLAGRSLLLDIDGTITARDGAICPGLAATLERLRESRVAIGCATARTPPAARLRLGALGWLAEEGVFQNGSLVLTHGRVAWAVEMEPATVRAAANAARQADPGVVIAIHRANTAPAFSSTLTPELLAMWGVTAAQVRPFAQGLAEPAIKLGMWMPGEAPGSIRAVHAAVQAAVGDHATVYEADEARFVFLTAHGIDKATGGRAWFAVRGLDPARAAAAGDDRTDAPLLRLCGHGIAFTDGHPETRAAAAVIADPPPSSGLADALARWAAA